MTQTSSVAGPRQHARHISLLRGGEQHCYLGEEPGTRPAANGHCALQAPLSFAASNSDDKLSETSSRDSPCAQPGRDISPLWGERLPLSGPCPLTSPRSCPQLFHPVDREPVHPSAHGALLPLALAVALLGLRGGSWERVPTVALCSVRQARIAVSPAKRNTSRVIEVPVCSPVCTRGRQEPVPMSLHTAYASAALLWSGVCPGDSVASSAGAATSTRFGLETSIYQKINIL